MAPPNLNEIRIRAIASAVSRGTERLVLSGGVPPSEYGRMRGPHQAGDFPGPVKYGYAVVGEAQTGALAGMRVFVLHPHENRFNVPHTAAVPVPEGVPARRATLAANIETAMTVTWDAGVSVGERVLVVGAGVVGLLVARLAGRVPGTEVTVADIDPAKAGAAQAMGVDLAAADTLPQGHFDVSINASASGEGLAAALEATAQDGRIVEASWHGAKPATLPLGGAFHARRLTIRSSQVGTIPPEKAPRWTHRRRIEKALELAHDEALDALLTHHIELREAPEKLGPLILHERSALAITIGYEDAGAVDMAATAP